MVKSILSSDCLEPIETPDAALKAVNEKLGLDLNVHDSNIVEVLPTIHEQKVLLTMILTQRLPKHHDTPEFSTPSVSKTPVSTNTYYTAPTKFDHNMTTKPDDDSHQEGYHTPNRVMHPIRRNLTQLSHLQHHYPDIGPELSDETTQDDLLRHERAFLHPPVRSKTLNTIMVDKDLAVSDLQVDNNQKQALGDKLFPLIHSEIPIESRKVTGMLLDLPNEEISTMLINKDLLRQWINKALNTLSEHNKNAENLCTKLTNVKLQDSDAGKPELDNNDHHNAMFQEIISNASPMINN